MIQLTFEECKDPYCKIRVFFFSVLHKIYRVKYMKKYIRIFLYWYLAGFALGIIGANLLFKETGYQSSLLAVYAAASEEVINAESLFGKLLFQRGFYFTFMIFIGLTYIGSPAVIISLLWFGFLAGNLLTVFLLEYGLKGIAVSISCFMPQMIFYIPGWILLFWIVIRMSQKSWGKRRKEKADYQAYAFFGAGACVCILLGIWLESYVNQKLLVWIFQHWL